MAHDDETATVEVAREDHGRTRVVYGPVPDPADGEVLLQVDRFALTANNVTYAHVGDALGYWRFFPAEEGWGRVPAMGFADVARSRHPEVAEGERVFGFFPMSTHLVIRPDPVRAGQLVDAAPHRQDTAPTYRQYTRCAADPLYEPDHEDAICLLRGLFLTSFLVDDFHADHDDFGARAFLVSSASSKTAVALAQRLAARRAGTRVALTSPPHRAFVEGLGCYDRVLDYDDLESLPADVPTAFVDHTGSGELVGRVHRHLGPALRQSTLVGATHRDAGAPPTDLPGAPPRFFFAPTQIGKRTAEWGAEAFQERVGEAWRGFRAWSDGWLRVVRGRGPAEVQRVWQALRENPPDPAEGHVLAPQPPA